MKLSRTGRLTGLALSGALTLSACGTDSQVGSTGSGGISCAQGSLTAAGSSAQKNAMEEWVKAYQNACSGATINYQPVGSGAGIQQFTAGSVDFAGSDSALKPEEATGADRRCATGKAVNLPMVTGPVAIAYNLAGVDGLVLDAPTIARIFSGRITRWNDPAVAKLNPGAKLPSAAIQAFHRSDESGTTDNVQKYLAAAAPADWTYGPGKKFNGPGGQSAAKSDGVTGAVKSTPNAITYTEFSFAKNASLGIARIATGAASPAQLTTASASAAVAAAKIVGSGNDLKLKLDYATKAAGAYPLILVTYEIACEKGLPADRLALVKSFLAYAASSPGQAVLEKAGYAPLPDEIRTKVAGAVQALS